MPSLSWREGERRQPQNDASQCQTRLASVTEGRNVVTAHHCKRQHPDIPRGHAGATCFGEGQEKRPPAFRVSSLLGGSWRSRLTFCGDSVLKRKTRVKFGGMSVFDTQRKCFPEKKSQRTTFGFWGCLGSRLLSKATPANGPLGRDHVTCISEDGGLPVEAGTCPLVRRLSIPLLRRAPCHHPVPCPRRHPLPSPPPLQDPSRSPKARGFRPARLSRAPAPRAVPSDPPRVTVRRPQCFCLPALKSPRRVRLYAISTACRPILHPAPSGPLLVHSCSFLRPRAEPNLIDSSAVIVPAASC